MSARRRAFRMLTLGAVLTGCSGASRVPPGLPPPEYERPAVSPWPPAGATDAALGGEPQAGAPAAEPPVGVPPGAAGAAGE